MSEAEMSLKEYISACPRILLTDTNRWPVVARLVIAFRRMGCSIGVLCPTPGHPVQKVSGVERVFHYSGLAPLESLRAAIETFDPDIIVPACDRSVQHLHELHAICRSQDSATHNIAALIECSLGSPDSFPVVSSRSQLLKLAQSEGILVPETTPIETFADLQNWNAKSVPPWIIKVDGTWGGQGVRIAKDAKEAKHFLREYTQRAGVIELMKRLLLNRDRDWVFFGWKHSRRAVIAQSIINGRPANCAVACWQGEVLAGIAVEVIKARKATGPATVVQVVPGEEMLDAAEKIARRLGLSGFFGLDFMIERDTGAVYLIEMNPRCTPPCPLPLGEGRNLVAAIWAQLTGKLPPGNQTAIEQSVIAYFPHGTKCSEKVDGNGRDDSIYSDIPMEEPNLIRELLQPRSGRSLVGELFDYARRKQHQETEFVAFSLDGARTPIENKRAAKTVA
jgi:hypothetical protein